uniref:Uncharacterized protein n=1 Tax=Anguilla anguilla TaxID=7936 RepID=A0A0E9PTA2_ANGAN
MIGGTTYVSSCYEKHLNNFSSGLLVCFCVLCCYSTKDRLCRGVYRQSERGRTLHTASMSAFKFSR